MPAAVESMAYVGEVPWHGLGNDVEEGSTPEQMRIAAGLDWDVGLQPLKYTVTVDGKRRERTVKEKALIRMDTLEKLSLVGPRYVPFQNHEILGFFREYVAAGDMSIETAGSLNGGRQIWALAKMNKSFQLGSNTQPDVNHGYVLLMNPHEYGKSMIAKFTMVRAVCWNTIMAALRGEGDSVKLWHIGDGFTEEVQQEAKSRLGIARERMDAMEENANKLTLIEITPEKAIAMATKYFGGDTGAPNKPAQRVIDLFNGQGRGSLLPSARGTAWGFLNAASEFTDHFYGRDRASRIHRAWVGSGDVLKRRVMAELLVVEGN